MLVVGICSPNESQSQAATAQLRGTVVSPDGVLLSEVMVIANPGERMTRTDSLGRFTFRLPPGTTTLTLKKIGFLEFIADVEIERGRNPRVAIEMLPVPPMLDSVVTTADRSYMPAGAPAYLDAFSRRKAEGKGNFFTRSDIERAGSVRAALGQVAGVQLRTTAQGSLSDVVVSRCGSGGRIAWYGDGQRLGNQPPVIHDPDIEAVEIYKSPTTMPMEAIGNACAAVYIWTRR